MFKVFIKSFLIILFSLPILVESMYDARFGHASTIINDKLYIIGGQPKSQQMTGSNDVFYLDLKKSFNMQNPSWTDLTKTSGLPLSSLFGSAVTLGNDGILLFEGYTWDLTSNTLETGENSLYLFNTTSGQWTIPTASGKPPVRRRELKIVSNNNNGIYIFGGIQLFTQNPQWLMDLHILDISDISNLNWELAQTNNPPAEPMADYTATLLPSGVIAYIGGRISAMGQIQDVNITKITMYDTKDATWYLMVTEGITIDNRSGHSAVLTQDGRIIIYGGVKGPNSISATPELVVLDTNYLVYKWLTPTIPSKDRPPMLTFHTADIYGDYMIVTFGNITNENAPPTQTNSNIYMLDTKSYSWMDSYTSSASYEDPNKHVRNTLGLILGLTSGGIVFAIIGSVVGLLIYKKYKDREPVIPTPGSGEVRDSVITVETVDSSNNEDYRNSVGTDNSMTTPLRPDSRGSSGYSPPRYPSPTPVSSNNNMRSTTTSSHYVPYSAIGGLSPKNPPYSSRK